MNFFAAGAGACVVPADFGAFAAEGSDDGRRPGIWIGGWGAGVRGMVWFPDVQDCAFRAAFRPRQTRHRRTARPRLGMELGLKAGPRGNWPTRSFIMPGTPSRTTCSSERPKRPGAERNKRTKVNFFGWVLTKITRATSPHQVFSVVLARLHFPRAVLRCGAGVGRSGMPSFPNRRM